MKTLIEQFVSTLAAARVRSAPQPLPELERGRWLLLIGQGRATEIPRTAGEIRLRAAREAQAARANWPG